jgi:hypothetical protein
MRTSAWIAVVLVGMTGLMPVAPGDAASPTPRQMVARYFGDLNAHRFYAAWLLEAPCRTSYSVSNGAGAPAGSGGFAGRGAWRPQTGSGARRSILASAHITGIRQLRISVLDRAHIEAFGVSGRYRFDYSATPWANDRHASGFHVIEIAVWKCDGRWGVEPAYWEDSGGGPLEWT